MRAETERRRGEARISSEIGGRRSFRARCILALAAQILAAGAWPAFGQNTDGLAATPRTRVVEEIIVTAQKREQAIIDVPISISVLDGDFITEEGITDVRDALLYVPNVRVDPTTFAGGPRCRGLTINALNRAFEPPCGLALDGVPYTRSAYFQAALFDTQRIEVLRGPQGTTFGKNSTAGVINLISKDPTDEFAGHVDLQLGELDRRRVAAAIGGPIVPGVLNFRAAGLSDERDGFLRNTTAAISPGAVDRPGSRDRKGFRVKLGLPDLFGSELKLSYERIELESRGAEGELYDVTPELTSYLRGFDPNVDVRRRNLVLSQNEPSGALFEIDTVQADWSYDLADWTVVAVAAHSVLDDTVELDVEFTPVPGQFLRQSATNPTTTAEIRTASPSLAGLYGLERLFGWNLGRSDVLGGIFYQTRKLEDSKFYFRIHDGPYLGLIAAGSSPGGVGFPFPLPSEIPPTGADIVEEVDSTFDQSAETIAGFAQLQWFFAERWMIQYGMRLSNETKDAAWDQRISDPAPVLAVANFQEFTAAHSVSEFEFQPKLTLNYEPVDGVGLFAHWSRGFKGGGFNALAFAADQAGLTFDAEAVTEWGIDAKAALLDGAARVNVSLFRMELEDFQVLTQVLSPTFSAISTGQQVVNAAEARAQGIEADLAYQATDWLNLIATVGLNDTEYLEFPINSCSADRQNTDGDDDPRCDATGRPFAYAPEWNNTLTLNVRHPLATLLGLGDSRVDGVNLGGLDLVAGSTLEYIDVHYLDDDLDPRRRQPSFFRVKADVGLANSEQGWSFRVTGENLTNELTSIERADVSPVFVDVVEPPRLFFAQLRWDF